MLLSLFLCGGGSGGSSENYAAGVHGRVFSCGVFYCNNMD